jgi:indole-3-glycerol phosphate synthase
VSSHQRSAPPTSFLDRAVQDARRHSEARQREIPLAELRETALATPRPRGFASALQQPGIAVVAEVKRRSPSRGPIREDLDAAALARAYADGGAACVSVLTEPEHFSGSPDDLRAVRAAVDVPVLRKDFVTTPYQVWEARAWGADAVLLIVAAFSGGDGPGRLGELLQEAAAAGLDALVEVHDHAEAAVASAAAATLVGVNARDLTTLSVDPDRFAAVRGDLPPDAVVVAESGISTRADVAQVEAAGADAVLVGESLVRSADPARAVAALRG